MASVIDFEALSLRLERETGYDSIRTVISHYSAYDDGGMERLPDIYECVMPRCKFRRKNPTLMWVHAHFGPHGLSFGRELDEFVADPTLPAREPPERQQ